MVLVNGAVYAAGSLWKWTRSGLNGLPCGRLTEGGRLVAPANALELCRPVILKRHQLEWAIHDARKGAVVSV